MKRVAVQDADGVYRYEFESLTEAFRHARRGMAAFGPENDRLIEEWLGAHEIDAKTGTGKGDAFTNGYDFERVEAAMADPPAHLVSAVDAMRAQLLDRLALPMTRRRRVRRGVDWGEDLDADRFLARDPNVWVRTEREPQVKRTAYIGCNLAVAWFQKPDELLWRGAATMALADALTRRGVNVGIVLFFSGISPANGIESVVVRFVAKDPQMPLDRAGLTLAACEIAWFRLVALWATAKTLPGRLRPGLGYVRPLPKKDRQALDAVIDSDVNTREAAERWVREALNQFQQQG